jgi:hypothetical protein
MQEEKVPESVSYAEPRSRSPLWGVALGVLACVAIGALGFVVYQRSAVNQMAAQNAAMSASLEQTRSQLQQMTTKLNQMSEAQQQAEAARAARQTAVQHRAAAVHRDDPRWKQVQDELAAHQKAIESTQTDLSSAKTELSGSIAHTHEQLVALARKGERNYFEFDLNKSKQFQREGPIGISLRKVSTKHDFADLELMVDDAQLTKKHVNMFEPVMLYTSESKLPVELVINQVGKDHIHGYVSTAKYKPGELKALTGLTDNGGDNASPSSAQSSDTPQLRSRDQQH